MFILYFDFYLYVNNKAANIPSAVSMSPVLTTLTGSRGLKSTKREVTLLDWHVRFWTFDHVFFDDEGISWRTNRVFSRRIQELRHLSQNSYYSCFCCFHFMFAFSCFVFACRNLVVSFSLSKFVRFIVNYL